MQECQYKICIYAVLMQICRKRKDKIMCDTNSSIGKRIRELRKSVNMSQDALGYVVKKNGTTIGRYEKDELPVPSDVLEILSDHFNVSIDYIVLGKTKDIQELDRFLDRTALDALTLFEHLSVSDQKEIIEIMQFKLYKRGQEWDVVKMVESSPLGHIKNDDMVG
jgi:transcriptional regulator with XRE-family HTH domain